MLATDSLWRIIGLLILVVSSLFWGAVMFLALGDSTTRLEKQVKKVLFYFFAATAFGWITILIYLFYPSAFVWLNSLAYFSYLAIPVLFCHFVYILTEPFGKRFSLWHYALPVLIACALLFWSFFIPFEIQLKLVTGRGAIVGDYPVYSRFFLSKPPVRLLFGAVYTTLSLVRLIYYYRKVNKNLSLRRPAPWIIALMAFSVMLLVLSAVVNTGSARGRMLSETLNLISYTLTTGLHVVIGYNVLRRNFLLYMPLPEASASINVEQSPQEIQEELPAKRTYTRHTPVVRTEEGKTTYKKLTRKNFEAYIRAEKPFLDPQLKITDLLEPLHTNRTILSGFVNQTYGVNFNRYLNRLRLEEFNRLRELPGGEGKPMDELIVKAGFGARRNYLRTLEAEKELIVNKPVKIAPKRKSKK